MKLVKVFNHKTQMVKATVNVSDFVFGSPKRTMYIKQLHEKKYWLKCCCRIPNAIMYPRLQNHSYTLVNDPINGMHHAQCELYTVVSGNRLGKDGPLAVTPTPPLSFTPIKLGNINKQLKERPKNNTGTPKKNHIKKGCSIHNLLVFALSQAKFNIMHYQRAYNIKDLFATCVFEIPVCKNKKRGMKDVTVGDLTFFDPEQDNVAWKNIIEKKKNQFTPQVPLQCFIVLLVDNARYERNQETFIVSKDGRCEKYKCSRVSHHYERTVGPRLIYIVYALIENQWDVMTIYSHPIVSTKIPVLIDSNYERDFALTFLSNCEPNLKLMKFYHGQVHQGILLLPDFQMTNNTPGNYWSEIIEVMGMATSAEYVERKSHLVPAMASHYKLPVREVLPASLESDCESAIASVKKGNRKD